MATINSSIVIISLPAIFTGIKLNPLEPGNVSYLLWMLMGYMLVTAVLVVMFGRMGDQYGRVKHLQPRLRHLHHRRHRAVPRPVHRRPRRHVADRLAVRAGRRRRDAVRQLDRHPDGCVPRQQARLRPRPQPGRRDRRKLHRPHRRRRPRRDRLARRLLRLRARSASSAPSGRSSRCTRSARRTRAASTGSATRPSRVGLIALLTGITYGIQPYGGSSQGWGNPWVLGSHHRRHPAARRLRRDRAAGAVADVRHAAVPHPRVLVRDLRRVPRRHRPRRPAVHADHLAAGHLAAAARLQLRGDAALGGHLHAADHHRLPHRGPDLRRALRPVRRAGLRHGRARCSSPRPSSGCSSSR